MSHDVTWALSEVTAAAGVWALSLGALAVAGASKWIVIGAVLSFWLYVFAVSVSLFVAEAHGLREFERCRAMAVLACDGEPSRILRYAMYEDPAQGPMPYPLFRPRAAYCWVRSSVAWNEVFRWALQQ